MEKEKEYCEECGTEIKDEINIFLGRCDACRTYCSHCNCETTGEEIYDGLCEDCEEDRLDELEDDEY